MKKVLLVYLPFCTPASPPYSITNLYAFLKANYEGKVEVLDLNLEFHKLKFPEYQKYFQEGNWEDYEIKTNEFLKLSSKVYSENNKKVVVGEKPELIDELLEKIKEKNDDVVAFSIVYSSQAFYAQSLLKELKKLNIKTVIGGPAINSKLVADKVFNSEVEFLEYLGHKGELNFNYNNDYSIYELKDYFTPHPVIPIKTTSSCYYQKCTFCSHHANKKYVEYPLNVIKQNIINSNAKYFFIIDDMIHVKRLLEFAELIKDLNIIWACQLKPTKEFTYEILKQLKESGLTLIIWGVESGNDRILKLMKKGTNTKDISEVLMNSKKAGIRNVTYIMFGFPTETKEEFLDTINFLKENEENIELISTSVFGLQRGTPIYNNFKDFGIKEIIEQKRTVLEPKISYIIEEGLTNKEAVKLRDKYKRTIDKINKYPKGMNFFREHMICFNKKIKKL